jgi:hypothetical protein
VEFFGLIAHSVVASFPDSHLEELEQPKKIYKIVYDGNVLITIDSTEVFYHIPNRYRNNKLSWSGFIEGSLEAISDLILTDLADIDQKVFNRQGKRIRKRPVRLNEHTVCPKCRTSGTIKRYFFGDPNQGNFAQRLARDRVVLGRSRRPNDPEAICTQCDWKGSTEIFRFGGKEA